ncbi:hypothetical protein NC797_04675 [Aquibacillus sp. 3ASR75-11]|uniref:DUF6884 domain-containing protein n=1 Tax=Terrihalobacillus insolitus TaxID=2950438 RepID=A0A9X4AMS4_9BACI|nr:DUF6884 domain-containing protein [Terrihalobacillus insolitus]MDC3412720.1 hypothetical protein [Terrihalobacillus insolitus]MDC3423803.1 hypothetical protein [Terrihalobacillus insolitus]
MKQLGIIPCGNKKIWDKNEDVGPVRAKEAYIGTFHTLCEQYATTFLDRWVILSAKYGYLDPDDIVDGPYDVTFNQNSKEVIKTDFLQSQVKDKGLGQYKKIVVLTGKKYKPIVLESFEAHENGTILFPLLGTKGIGYMQQMLKRSLEEHKPIHL